MNSRYTKIIIALLVAIAVILFVGLALRTEKPEIPKNKVPTFNASEASTTEILNTLETKKFIPQVPTNATATTPKEIAPAAPNVEEKLGFYDMSVSKTGFSPSNITIKKGDLVQIRLTATDGEYDFSMPYTGMYVSVKKGETKNISFQTTDTGTFQFECRDFCPAGGKIRGEVVVIPR